jgi:ligand-binding sensor domain-containing protein/signal transduction histidine kinase
VRLDQAAHTNNTMGKLLAAFWKVVPLLAAAGCVGASDIRTAVPDEATPPFVAQDTDGQTAVSGISPVQMDAPLQFERLSSDWGLSSSVIFSIETDSNGFLWFGTASGLNRFDGKRIETFRHIPGDDQSLSNDVVRSLYLDASGVLWVGTDDGLNRFDAAFHHFETYSLTEDPENTALNAVNVIYEDSQSRFWVGTDGGLGLFERQDNNFVIWQNDPDLPESLSSNVVLDIFEDSNGSLWIATGNGLEQYMAGDGSFEHYQHNPQDPNSLPHNIVQAINEDEAGFLWVGLYDGSLAKLDQLDKSFEVHPFDYQDLYTAGGAVVWDLQKDNSGKFWVGTARGLYLFDPLSTRFSHYGYNPVDPDDVESLSSAVIRTIHWDPSGVYWVGTSGGGVNRFNSLSQRFVNFDHRAGSKQSLSSDVVLSILEDDSLRLWVGTAQGLNRLDAGSRQIATYHSNENDNQTLSGDEINALFQGEDGRLWVTANGGLNLYDSRSDLFSPFNYRVISANGSVTQSDQIKISTIIQDAEGMLWLGTSSQAGLLALNPVTRIATQPFNQQLAGKHITALFLDGAQNLWVGSAFDGLYRISTFGGTIQHFETNPNDSDSLSDNSILSLFQDSAGRMWVGTQDGLDKFEPASQTFSRFNSQDGLEGSSVYSMVEDKDGNLWLSTNRGISEFDPWGENVRNFDQQDGLRNMEFNPGASAVSRSGRLFFGGRHGMSAFYPAHIEKNRFSPPVVLTSLTQSGEAMTLDAPVATLNAFTVEWPRNYFEFTFAGLSYLESEKNQYAYRMEGYDSQWQYTGTATSGRYTNLPEGSYTLRIIASNNDGIWNTEGISIGVEVLPPFWRTIWFQGGLAFVVLVVVAGSYGFRLLQVQTRSRQLAAEVAERTQEIERRRQAADGLREILIRLNANQPLGKSLNLIALQANQLLAADHVCLFEIKASMPEVITAARQTADGSSQLCNAFDIKTRYPAEVLQWLSGLLENEKIRVIDELPSNMAGNAALEGICSVVMAPILLGSEVYGGLSLLFGDHTSVLEEAIGLLRSFAEQATLAVGNARLREQAEQVAVVSERNRLARDLHDAVTQTLFSASLIAEALPTLYKQDPQEGHELLEELRQLNRGAMAEMRTLLLELRPAAVVGAKLEDLLKQLAEAVSGRTGIPVDIKTGTDYDLPDDVHIVFYRIAQEALANVVKHASAERISLSLQCGMEQGSGCQEWIVLRVEDDGCGFKPQIISSSHFGLMNMRERAESINATLSIISTPQQGTHVEAKWCRKEDVNG